VPWKDSLRSGGGVFLDTNTTKLAISAVFVKAKKRVDGLTFV
jgi:hypothetical protein